MNRTFSHRCPLWRWGSYWKQVYCTQMLPALTLSNRLQQENFSQLHRIKSSLTPTPQALFFAGRKAHNGYFWKNKYLCGTDVLKRYLWLSTKNFIYLRGQNTATFWNSRDLAGDEWSARRLRSLMEKYAARNEGNAPTETWLIKYNWQQA